MSDKKSDESKKPGELERRSVLVGGAVTAATGIGAASVPVLAQVPTETVGILAAGYGDYPDNFSGYFFSDQKVVASVQNIKKFLNPAGTIEWGTYQKYAPDDPTDQNNWDRKNTGKGKKRYESWESAVAEAREDLKKLPKYAESGAQGPDPDNPTVRKPRDSMLDELDKAVTIALLNKYMQNQTGVNTGVPITVSVTFQPYHWRRHQIITEWQTTPYSLTIKMTCPNGGWIGTALWKKYDEQYDTLGKVTEFRASMTVPKKPKDYGQILFLFNGLESLPSRTDMPAILQPVLQWTKENVGSGTGGTWAVRSWYVPASYKPLFNQMPDLKSAVPFTTPKAHAWTEAQPVEEGDTIEGVIKWMGDHYRASLLWKGQEVAVLDAPGIAPLTYPVAVIEAYAEPKGKLPGTVPKDGLVDVDMTNIVIRTELHNAPVWPDWDIGSDTPKKPPIEFDTNSLKRYKITVDNRQVPITSLSFKAKQT